MWGGGSAKKLKYVGGGVREKIKMWGGGPRNFPFCPPLDLKWNSPKSKSLEKILHIFKVANPAIQQEKSCTMIHEHRHFKSTKSCFLILLTLITECDSD